MRLSKGSGSTAIATGLVSHNVLDACHQIPVELSRTVQDRSGEDDVVFLDRPRREVTEAARPTPHQQSDSRGLGQLHREPDWR